MIPQVSPSRFNGLLGTVLVCCVSALTAPAASAQLYADFETTLGNFTVELHFQDVPRTVANFVSLAEGTRPWTDPRANVVRSDTPFYDGLIFHRVIKNFMNQGGSFQGTGSDGPGYRFPDEFPMTPAGDLIYKHEPGVISMANSGTNTNGSQFFIVASNSSTSHLNGVHSVFGKVAGGPFGSAEAGMAVVNAINTTATGANDRPVTDVVIQKVRIRRVGAAAEAFDEGQWQLPHANGAVETRLEYFPSEEAFYFRFDAKARHGYEVVATSSLQDWRTARSHLLVPSAIPEAYLDITALTWDRGQPIPSRFFYLKEADYSELIASTMPPLSNSAVIELKFLTPARTLRLTRQTDTGSWKWLDESPSEGTFQNFYYGPGQSNEGLLNPRLTALFEAPLPWSTGVAVKSLTVVLTFKPGTSPTEGQFQAAGTTTTNTQVSSRGFFQLVIP